MPVATYTKTGGKSTTAVKLDKKIFGVDVKDYSLLKLAYQSYLANGRINLAKTKKRGEVRGGGRKPIRQKGTGNARVGSTRNPLQTGGGVTFGPSGNENYSIKLNQESKRSALRQALSLSAKSEKIVVIEDFTVSSGKTKDAVSLLSKIDATGKVLLVVGDKTDLLARSLRNINNVRALQARYLNVYEVINADKVVLTKSALLEVNETLGSQQ